MAAGRVPFAGIRPDEFYTQVLAGTRRPPMGDRWPQPLRALLTRCWEKNPEDRPTMKEVADTAQSLLERADAGDKQLSDPKACCCVVS